MNYVSIPDHKSQTLEMSENSLYIGLMSGTSMDGIDAALLDFQNGCHVLETTCEALPKETRSSLLRLVPPDGLCVLNSLGELDQALGRLFGQAAIKLIEKSKYSLDEITAIGSHGQTIHHRPANNTSDHIPFTIQIGDPNVIAETTGITTVADFRRRDMAVGGQGAPLVPAFHAAVFAKAGETRSVINIGGIANITIIDKNSAVFGFDIGPGNCLMDQWTLKHFNKPYDTDGAIAKQGSVSTDLLASFLNDRYFEQPHPKSTGPEYFNLRWLQKHIAGQTINKEDVLRTLNQFTATTIAQAISQHAPASHTAYFCGGGVHNNLLISAITSLLPDIMIQNTGILGINPDYVEAAAFGWLAKQTLERKAGNIPGATGARKSVILGGVYYS